MKLTNKEIKSIQKILTAIGDKEIDDCGLAFKIARNNHKLMQIAESIVKVENDILKKYGEKDKDGTLIVRDNGDVKIVNAKKYHEDIETLMKTECETDIDCFDESEILKIHATPNQIVLLMPIVK